MPNIPSRKVSNDPTIYIVSLLDFSQSEAIRFFGRGANFRPPISGPHQGFFCLINISMIALAALRESFFGVFYIMTEQNNQHSKRITLGAFRRCVLYLIDAGQVIRALVLPSFGWDPGVEKFAQKFDFFQLIFDLVRKQFCVLCMFHNFILDQVSLPSVPRVPFYLTSVALVSVAILNILFVMQLFQVHACSWLGTRIMTQ